MHNFFVSDFEGPLDLLLHLIKQSKMDIYEINIVEITKQYLKYIKSMKELNLDVASEYLVMAAELIEMKSRYLLPKKEESETDDYEENLEEELKRRLLEYKRYKESAKKFKEMEVNRHNVFTKSPEKLSELTETKTLNNENTSVFDLLDALESVMKRIEYAKPLNTKIAKKELSVKERMIKIKEILTVKKKVKFQELFDIYNKQYIIVTFISILNMARDNEVIIKQPNTFGEIYLERVE